MAKINKIYFKTSRWNLASLNNIIMFERLLLVNYPNWAWIGQLLMLAAFSVAY